MSRLITIADDTPEGNLPCWTLVSQSGSSRYIHPCNAFWTLHVWGTLVGWSAQHTRTPPGGVALSSWPDEQTSLEWMTHGHISLQGDEHYKPGTHIQCQVHQCMSKRHNSQRAVLIVNQTRVVLQTSRTSDLTRWEPANLQESLSPSTWCFLHRQPNAHKLTQFASIPKLQSKVMHMWFITWRT